MKACLFVSVLLGFFVLPAPAVAQPSGDSSANWVTAGPVHAVARSGSTLFVGGDFTAIAPKTQQVGAFVTFTLGGCPMPPVNGTVYAIVADGIGGFFVGGRFDRIGSLERRNLARLTGGCEVDAAWSGIVDGTVRALARVASFDSTLFVGGVFSQAGQQGGGLTARSNLAAFGATDGVLRPWNPGANGQINALQAQLASDVEIVYVGGDFTSVAGQPRAHLAAVDETGAATAFVADADAPVLALHLDAAASPARLAVGGEFATLAGMSRNRIGILIIDGAVNVDAVFDPGADGAVRALTATSLSSTTGVVYAGGDFTHIGGAARNYVAAIGTSGIALPFDPNPNGSVHTVALEPYATSALVIGGRFTHVGGAQRLYAALVNDTSGAALAWNPSFNGPVYAITSNAAGVGPYIAVGGEFDATGARLRRNLAAINLDTGELLPFAPNVDNVVRALAVFRDVLYVGGDFQHVDQLPRGRLAAIETATRSLTVWSPNADGPVHALAVRADVGSTIIYVGGDFASIGTALRGRVAAIDAASGVATGWTPPVFDGVVEALETFEHLYVGGAFANAGGASAAHLARLDLATGARDVTWAPAPDGEVRALCVGEGFSLFAGGQFSVAGGAPRSNLVQLDLTTGLASAWQPDPNGAVNAVSCFPSLMAGGEFTTIGSGAALQTRPRLAELSTSATGPSGTYATSFMTDDVGIVLDITGRPGPDGVSVGAVGEPSSGDEPAARLAFFARDFAGSPGRPSSPNVGIFPGPNGSKTVRLRWAPPARGPRPTSYRLYAGSAPGVYNYANGLPVPSTEFEAAAPVRLPIYVRVQAVNAFGAGPLSEELTFLTEDFCTAPPDPPEFTTSVNGSNVTINWTTSSGDIAHTYRLEAGLGSGRSDFVYEFPSSQTSFSVAAPTGVYFVRLRAIGYCGMSLRSSEVPVVAAGSNAPATPPRNLGVGLDSHNSVRVSWSPPSVGVPVAYRLEAGTGFGLNNLGTLTTTETTVWFLGVAPGTYYLRVYAIGAAGSTAASDEVIFVRP